MGNPYLDFQNLNLDFPIEREIRKRISPPRNPSSGWISIKKSKSGFFGFPFLSFDWEIRERTCKTVLVNSGRLFTNYACACKTAVQQVLHAGWKSSFRTGTFNIVKYYIFCLFCFRVVSSGRSKQKFLVVQLVVLSLEKTTN